MIMNEIRTPLTETVALMILWKIFGLFWAVFSGSLQRHGGTILIAIPKPLSSVAGAAQCINIDQLPSYRCQV